MINSWEKMMEDKQEFKKKLTQEEISIEIDKVKDFFKQIPEGMKATTAEMFIREIVNWSCGDHYQALGIFQEAMNSFRETSLQAIAEEVQKEELQEASENVLLYRCLQGIDWMEDSVVANGIYRIGYAGEDERYAGGKKYIIFKEDGSWMDICQRVLDDHFELMEDIN